MNSVLDIKYEGAGPIHNIIDVALIGSAHNEVVKLEGHVYYSFSKIEVFIDFVQAISHIDLVIFVQLSFNMCPGQLSVNNVAKSNTAISSSPGTNSSIVIPG